MELLLTRDPEKARQIAEDLDVENKERQATEMNINREALEMIAADPNADKKKVIVLAREGWHNGVIGIVASRITEMFYKPCILISLNNGVGKGSGRSISGFNLFEALSDSEKYLTNFGGHAVAAGLGITENNIKEFTANINKYADQVLSDNDMIPSVKIDSILGGQSLSLATARAISALEPYGMGNERPVFVIKDAAVQSITTVGADNKHLRLRIEKDGAEVGCIGFGLGEFAQHVYPGDRVHLAFRFDINVYQGNESLQLQIIDIKK